MNYFRLGFTESFLLFDYYLTNVVKLADYQTNGTYVNWLHTTSGFYDKTIKGSYFDFDATKCLKSEVYNMYFKTLLQILQKFEGEVALCLHNRTDEYFIKYKDSFMKYINKSVLRCVVMFGEPFKQLIYNVIENKNVLIINNLGVLMKTQVDNGNLKKCFPNFTNVKNIHYLNPGYTFFNSGPDNSILDTANKLFEQIDLSITNNNIDIVIISVGAYSILLGDYVNTKKKKQVVIAGGELSYFFGIKTKRTEHLNSESINEHFISVPDDLKPPNYDKIENGCYW